jgi:hypothetical protein
MVMPGDNVSFTVELIAPIAMEDGLRFAIREGGRTVGAGVVIENGREWLSGNVNLAFSAGMGCRI